MNTKHLIDSELFPLLNAMPELHFPMEAKKKIASAHSGNTLQSMPLLL